MNVGRQPHRLDPVLDRPRESRSQFVVTTLEGGREGSVWQTARTGAAAALADEEAIDLERGAP